MHWLKLPFYIIRSSYLSCLNNPLEDILSQTSLLRAVLKRGIPKWQSNNTHSFSTNISQVCGPFKSRVKFTFVNLFSLFALSSKESISEASTCADIASLTPLVGLWPRSLVEESSEEEEHDLSIRNTSKSFWSQLDLLRLSNVTNPHEWTKSTSSHSFWMAGWLG